MSVAAKFYVAEVRLWPSQTPGESGEVLMRPVTRGEENKAWSSATPSGEIKMTISNPPAFKWFMGRLGKEVSISFTDFDSTP